MIQNFRVLNIKDTESPVESLIICKNPIANSFGTLNFNIPSSIVLKNKKTMILLICFEKKIRSLLIRLLIFYWWAFRDSNPGPTGYEPVALTN